MKTETEDRRKERIILTEEVGHKQEEVRTYESGVEVKEQTTRQEITLKSEIKQQMLLAKDEVSPCYSEDQLDEPLEDIEPASSEYEAVKLEETESQDEEDFDREDKAEDQIEEMSLRFISPPVKEAAVLPSKSNFTTPPETTRPTKKEDPGTKKEAYKKTQDKIFKKAVEQREVTSSVSVRHEETVSPVEEITVPKTSKIHKEVSLMKQDDSNKVEEVMPLRKTVLPPSDEDLPRHRPTVPPKQEIIAPTKMESPRKETPVVLLEKPTSLTEQVSTEEHVQAIVSPVPAQIPSPKIEVYREVEISPPKETALTTKKTSTALPKAAVSVKEDIVPEEVRSEKHITKDKIAPNKQSQVQPQKKHLPPKEETLQSKKPASYLVEVDSSEEARQATTKPPPTRGDDKKVKKGTQEVDQQTLQKGILSYLSRLGSWSPDQPSLEPSSLTSLI